MLHMLFDDIIDPSVDIVANDPTPLWWILGIVAGVATVTAVLIVILIKKKKKGGK